MSQLHKDDTQPRTPLVSVIIPAYNGLPYLQEAIESVLRQTYQHWELIIVDDGSTDETAQVAESYANRDARVHLIRQRNQGTAAARNHAIRIGRGTLLAFLDDDDRWLPKNLERQVACLIEHPEAAATFVLAHVIDAKGKPIEKILSAGVEPSVRTLLEQEEIWVPSQTMVRRNCLDTVGLFDEVLRVTADRDLWIRILHRYPIRKIPDALVEYRRHGNNVSSHRGLVLEDRVRVFGKVRPNPALGISRRSLRELIGRIHYQLAWHYLDRDQPAKGARHFLSAVLACPTIGLRIQRERPRPIWYRLAAPYLGFVIFGLRSIPQWMSIE